MEYRIIMNGFFTNLWFCSSFRKPLLDIPCNGEKDLLHIHVCLCTLQINKYAHKLSSIEAIHQSAMI